MSASSLGVKETRGKMVKFNKNNKSKKQAVKAGPRRAIRNSRRVRRGRDSGISFSSVPASRGARNATRQPRIFQRGPHTVVCHREYLGDVLTDALNQFAYDAYIGNPGDTTTFPWLNSIARRFESYRFVKHVMQYVGFAGTSTTGELTLAIDYDAQDETGSQTKATLLNTGNSVSGPLWDSFDHVSSRADLQRLGPYRYVNDQDEDELASPTVERTSSYGNLFVATSPTSLPAGTATGEIWIEYEVEFLTPVLNNGYSVLSPAETSKITPAIAGTTNDLLLFFEAAVNPAIGTDKPYAYVGQQSLGTLSGPPAMSPTGWMLPSGSTLPSGTRVLQFAKDFVGRMIVTYKTASTLMSLASAVVGVVSRLTNVKIGSSASQMGSATIERVLEQTLVAGTGYVGVMELDVNAPAGSGIILGAPSFSSSVNVDASCELFPVPNALAAAFRARQRERALMRERALLPVTPIEALLAVHSNGGDDDDGDHITLGEVTHARASLALGPDDQRPASEQRVVDKYLKFQSKANDCDDASVRERAAVLEYLQANGVRVQNIADYLAAKRAYDEAAPAKTPAKATG
jgi:hypothetical protein